MNINASTCRNVDNVYYLIFPIASIIGLYCLPYLFKVLLLGQANMWGEILKVEIDIPAEAYTYLDNWINVSDLSI